MNQVKKRDKSTGVSALSSLTQTLLSSLSATQGLVCSQQDNSDGLKSL